MNKKKIAKLRRELDGLRAGKYNLKTSDVVSLAKRIGRSRDTSRGKEPTYVSVLPRTTPLSIPGHPTINPYTANAILDVLEADLDRWQELAEQMESKEKQDEKRAGLPQTAVREDRDSGGREQLPRGNS